MAHELSQQFKYLRRLFLFLFNYNLTIVEAHFYVKLPDMKVLFNSSLFFACFVLFCFWFLLIIVSIASICLHHHDEVYDKFNLAWSNQMTAGTRELTLCESRTFAFLHFS